MPNLPYTIAQNLSKAPSETAAKILSFSFLPSGWDYGEGGPIPQLIIDDALAWERFFDLRGWDTNAGPGPDGEIAVSAKRGSVRIEVVIESNGTLTVAYDSEGTRISYKPRISAQEAHKLILEIVEPWSASASSTQTNMTKNQISGLSSLSEIHRVTDPYPYSIVNASNLPGAQFARIYGDIGRWSAVLLESQSYSGNSTQKYSSVIIE
jgi:hypothetical protein